MNIWNQIYYSVKRILIDRKPIVVRLLSFAVVILILGSAFNNSFDVTTLDKVNVLYCNDDSGEFGDMFLNTMTGVSDIKTLMSLKEVPSKEEAEKLINKGKAEALVYIPKDFSDKKIENGESKTVEVFMQNTSGINAVVVENVVNSFVNEMNTAGVIYCQTGSLDSFSAESFNSVSEEPLSHTKSPNSMGYYAVAMLLMLILYGMDYGRVGIGEDYLGTLGNRMKLSPIRPFEQYTGKVLGLSVVTFIQGGCIILFTKFVFDVNWGNNIGMILLILFSYSVLTTVLGAMLSILTGDLQKAGSLQSIAILVFTFLAGGFVAADFGTASRLSPSYYARNAIFNVVYDGNLNLAWRNIGIIWIIVLGFAIVSIIAAGRKRA